MIIHVFFFFNDTATTEIYTLSLHDALPIYEVETQQAAQPEPNHFRRPHFCVIFGIINTETAVRRVIIAIRKPFVDSRNSALCPALLPLARAEAASYLNKDPDGTITFESAGQGHRVDLIALS